MKYLYYIYYIYEVYILYRERTKRAQDIYLELQQQYTQSEIDLDLEKRKLIHFRNSRRVRSRYTPEIARTVLSLFPREQYEMFLNSKDEHQLRDIRGYLNLLLQGTVYMYYIYISINYICIMYY